MIERFVDCGVNLRFRDIFDPLRELVAKLQKTCKGGVSRGTSRGRAWARLSAREHGWRRRNQRRMTTDAGACSAWHGTTVTLARSKRPSRNCSRRKERMAAGPILPRWRAMRMPRAGLSSHCEWQGFPPRILPIPEGYATCCTRSRTTAHGTSRRGHSRFSHTSRLDSRTASTRRSRRPAPVGQPWR
jgi:hypothetical protein